MKKETSESRRSPIWNSLPVFHYVTLATSTAVWWLFMRKDDGPVELVLGEEAGLHLAFIPVIAGVLHFYLKATAHSKSRSGRIITALLCPFIGVSLFFMLIAIIALIGDPSGVSAGILFFGAFIAPICLTASWKAMVFPMILTCCLAEHIATLGNEARKIELQQLRKKLQSPAAAYLYSRTGRI